MKEYRKRSTLHLTADCHAQLTKLAKNSGISNAKMLELICTDIIEGKYDNFITRSQYRSIAIYRDSIIQLKDYLKPSDMNVTDILTTILTGNATHTLQGSLLELADLESLGNHLKTVRQFKQLSRVTAAKKGGVSVAWLQKIETCQHLQGSPDKEKLKKYCDFLGLNIEIQYTYIIR